MPGLQHFQMFQQDFNPHQDQQDSACQFGSGFVAAAEEIAHFDPKGREHESGGPD